MKSVPRRARLRIFRRSRADPVDRRTLAAYDGDAAGFARDWHEQPAPVDLHDTVKRFFIKGGSTADIGCGSGREGAWLNANGVSAGGLGAASGLRTPAPVPHPPPHLSPAQVP